MWNVIMLFVVSCRTRLLCESLWAAILDLFLIQYKHPSNDGARPSYIFTFFLLFKEAPAPV